MATEKTSVLKISFTDRFLASAEQGGIEAIKKLGRLGVMYASLAEEYIARLEKMNAPAALDQIVDIVLAHDHLIPKAIDILFMQGSGRAILCMGFLARQKPEWIGAVFEKLKTMDNGSAALEIYSISLIYPELTREAVDALRFRESNFSTRQIIEIGGRCARRYEPQFHDFARYAFKAAVEYSEAHPEKADKDVLVKVYLEDLRGKLSGLPAPSSL